MNKIKSLSHKHLICTTSMHKRIFWLKTKPIASYCYESIRMNLSKSNNSHDQCNGKGRFGGTGGESTFKNLEKMRKVVK